MGKEETGGRGRKRGRGGRGEYPGQFGRNSGTDLRHTEIEVEELSLYYLENIEIGSQAFEEVTPENHVVHVMDSY